MSCLVFFPCFKFGYLKKTSFLMYFGTCRVVQRPQKPTALSSQQHDSLPLWPLDRACHHDALITPHKYSQLASLTASNLPYQYYISMYSIHPLWIASHSIQTMPWIDCFPNSYIFFFFLKSLMQCSQQGPLSSPAVSRGRQWTMAYSRDRG